QGQPYEDYVRELVGRMLRGECDEDLIYRKRLRRPLDDYQRNVPPHVRAARMADEHHLRQGRPALYRKGGWIRYVMTLNGPEPMEARHS
ncbi:DNA polymerase II, partial [Acinetobacter baumannii]|nr:DNA polymerase II [Acinetobacter baumannii]